MAYVLSSVSGNLISAASAGWAPTNSADVSAIASAYAESAASSKQDTLTFSYDSDKISAINGSALAGQGGGGLVTAIGTSESGITSLNNSGLVDTAALHSADYSSLYVQEPLYISASGDSSYIGISGGAGDYLTAKVGSGQATFSTAFQDEMDKRPALVIAAERSAGAKMYPRMMVTDWNDTTGDTHSGMLLANAFEFYICPNSARGEVAPSGLVQSRLDASHLQFNVNEAVSAYKRSSEFTRSGMRLGFSGNSASWVAVSGNSSLGGFITLDDCSGTSGRIVASSIPYWNDKLDGSASSSYYTTANESGYVDSAYVESQVSSKQDTLTFDWDSNSAISSINGSALAGQGGGGGASIPFTGYYYDSATSATSVITADVTAVSSLAYTKYNGNVVNVYKGITDSQGIHHLGVASFIDAGAEINRDGYTLAFAPSTSMWKTSDVATGIFAPLQYGTGAGMFLNNGPFKGYLKGNEMFVCNTSIGQAARVEVHQSRGAHLCLTADKYGIVSGNFSPSEVVLSNGASHFTANLYANNNRGASLRLFGGTGSASNSQTSMAWLTPASLQVSNTASGTAKYAINSIALYDTDTSAQKTISSTSIDYWNGKQDALRFAYNTANQISSIDGSALAAGSTYTAGEGIDITDDVISVEAPVDIVAGPGIVIDNPDGNTLRVSTDENYETVLFEDTGSTGTLVANVVLSESSTHFSKLEITLGWAGGGGSPTPGRLIFTCVPDGKGYGFAGFIGKDASTHHVIGGISTNGTTLSIINCLDLYTSNNSSVTYQSFAGALKVFKVVGIHRIANN